MNLAHLKAIRVAEMELAIRAMEAEKPGKGMLLEVGAGTGWQAQKLTEVGYSVVAVDVPSSRYREHKIWPVILYDGMHFPFPDKFFDIVFSSNVLEHISDLPGIEKEIQRVLKDDGIATHVLPTASWRIWTSLTHYIHIMKRIIAIFTSTNRIVTEKSFSDNRRQYSIPRLILLALWPHRHGERGNALSEIFLFEKRSWRDHFIDSGWTVAISYPLKIFYTGNEIFGPGIPIAIRQRIAHVLGSATSLFILKKP